MPWRGTETVIAAAPTVPSGAQALGRREAQRSLNQAPAGHHRPRTRGRRRPAGVGIPIATFSVHMAKANAEGTPTAAAEERTTAHRA
jgi:hypothetical protein